MSQWHLVHLYGPGVWHWVHRIFGPLWGPSVTVCLDISEGITFLSWKVDKMSQNVLIILLRNMYVSWLCELFFSSAVCIYLHLNIVIFISGRSNIDIRVHSDIWHLQKFLGLQYDSNPRPLNRSRALYHSAMTPLFNNKGCRILDIG
jgi:hypothetical protein